MDARRRNYLVYTLLLLACTIVFWLFDNFYTPATYSDPELEAGGPAVPRFALPASTTGEVVHHAYYSLSYHEAYEQAEWVAYTLDRIHLTYDDRERPLFIEDPRVRSKSADWKNYRGSGYDRGHLCPAGDRRFSDYAYNETFYTSNISPQRSDFNAGVWNRLEIQVRRWARRYGTLYVITGGVLKKGLGSIGEEAVAVPEAFYKIVVRGDEAEPKVLAFLMPHRETNGSLPGFLVPVDSLEQITGIDFFHQLPDNLESGLEQSASGKGWKF